jgi:hypothetical protein
MSRKRNKKRADIHKKTRTAANVITRDKYEELTERSVAANTRLAGVDLDELRNTRLTRGYLGVPSPGARVSRTPFLEIDTYENAFVTRRKSVRKDLDDKDLFKFHRRSLIARVNHDIIAACRIAYRNYGMVRTVIDLMSNFISKLHIAHPDPQWRRFYRSWAAKVQLNERLSTFTRDILVGGQVFIFRSMATITQEQKRLMRRAVARGSEEKEPSHTVIGNELLIDYGDITDVVNPQIQELAQGESFTGEPRKVKKGLIPWSYPSLNPLQIEPTGSVIKGKQEFKFLIRSDDLDKIGNLGKDINGDRGRGGSTNYRGYIDEGETRENMPEEFSKRIKNAKSPFGDYDKEVQIPTDRLYVIYDKKFDWEQWAVPMVYPALKNLKIKELLRAMEARAAESFIASLLLVKLGYIDSSTGEIIGPPPEVVDDVADLIAAAAESSHLIWATPDIDMKYVQPDLSQIFNKDKTAGVDADILADLGASEVVVNGRGGGNYSNAFLSVASMLERLETIREHLKRWVMHELMMLSRAVGDNRIPSIRFEVTSLRDPRVQNDFMIKLTQMNVISRRTLLEYANLDPDVEMSEINTEQELMKKGEIPPLKGPFKDELDNKVREEKMREDEDGVLPSSEEQVERDAKKIEKLGEVQKKIQPKGENPQGPGQRGRPPGTEKPQSVKRDTKPRGMSRKVQINKAKYLKYRSEGKRLVNKIMGCLLRRALVAADTDCVADLRPEVRRQIWRMTERILGNTKFGAKITRSYIESFFTQAPAKLDRCVQDVFKQKVASYKKKAGKAPTGKKRKELLSSSWAICRSSLKK